MIADDKKIVVEKEGQSTAGSDSYNNPDFLSLSVDKATLNVFLAVFFSEESLTTRGVSARIYDAAIRKGMFLLGSDGFAAAKAIYYLHDLNHKNVNKDKSECT